MWGSQITVLRQREFSLMWWKNDWNFNKHQRSEHFCRHRTRISNGHSFQRTTRKTAERNETIRRKFDEKRIEFYVKNVTKISEMAYGFQSSSSRSSLHFINPCGSRYTSSWHYEGRKLRKLFFIASLIRSGQLTQTTVDEIRGWKIYHHRRCRYHHRHWQ